MNINQLNVKKNHWHIIVGCIIGNLLEWYDFILYAFFAAIIAQLFFPHSDYRISLLSSFGVFAMGYVVRPLGGVVLGYVGDRISRKRALILTILSMGLATSLIGILPTYQQWGVDAAIILTILRIIQGLAVGGEYPGAMVILVESTTPKHRAFVSSLGFIGAILGILLASIVAAIVSHYCTHRQLYQWGWRVPFLLGLLLAFFGLYFRLKFWTVEDEQIHESKQLPILLLFKNYLIPFTLCFLLWVYVAIYTGATSIFLVTYLTHYLNVSLQSALLFQSISSIVMGIFFVLGAKMCDILQCHKLWIKLGLAIMCIISYPIYWFMLSGGSSCYVAFLLLTAIGSIAVSPIIKLTVEAFPSFIRYTAMGLTQGLAFSLFAGTSAVVFIWLISHYGTIAPAFYITLSAAVAFLASVVLSKM